MKLIDFLTLYDLDMKEFAKYIGVSSTSLYLYIKDVRSPSLEVAVRIVEASRGEVRFRDLLAKDQDIIPSIVHPGLLEEKAIRERDQKRNAPLTNKFSYALRNNLKKQEPDDGI